MSKRNFHKTFLLCCRRKVFFLAGGTGLLLLLFLAGGCTEYERNGINARPFNEPRSWEINPYGQDAFRN